jgi:Protein of unknown function (DUF3465)
VRRSWHGAGVRKRAVTGSSWRRALLTAAPVALLSLAGCGGDSVDNAAFASDLDDHQAAEVTVQGTVVTLEPDSPDRGDGVHQRFVVSVDGTRVEIDHNLSLARRVPVAAGKVVVIHGQFEPDPGHPVIHYTHHATGRHEGGWIDLGGNRYE